jgi:uncharacterized protein
MVIYGGISAMRIDVHAHLGWDQVFDEMFSREEQLEKHAHFQVTATILQPATCHGLEDVKEQHDVIAGMTREFPGVFFGMANPNPHLKDPEYEAEVRRCVEELGFVGIKLHTFAHAVHPCGRDGRKVFRLACELGVPVMVHTGAGIPFANPCNLIPVAEEFPEVPIIMAHCGMMIMAGETPIAMKRCPNLYADLTWTPGFHIRHWSEELGAYRFMFGTDHADNTGTELGKLQTCGLADEQLEWILHKTARAVYKLKGLNGYEGFTAMAWSAFTTRGVPRKDGPSPDHQLRALLRVTMTRKPVRKVRCVRHAQSVLVQRPVRLAADLTGYEITVLELEGRTAVRPAVMVAAGESVIEMTEFNADALIIAFRG